MKKFEIEVVRTYTTTIEVELPDNLTPLEVEEITSYYPRPPAYAPIYDEIWDVISEKELEQMETELLEIKVKEL